MGEVKKVIYSREGIAKENIRILEETLARRKRGVGTISCENLSSFVKDEIERLENRLNSCRITLENIETIKKYFYDNKTLAKKEGREDDFIIYRTYVEGVSIAFRIPKELAKPYGENEPASTLTEWMRIPEQRL